MTTKKAQVEFAKKAALLAAENAAKKQHDIPVRVLSRTQMLELVGVSYASVWTWIKAGTFPPGRALSSGTNGRIVWLEHEVNQWMLSRPARAPKGSKTYRPFRDQDA